MLKLKLKQTLTLLTLTLSIMTGQAKEAIPIQGQVVAKAVASQIPDSILIQFNGEVIDTISGENTLLINFPQGVPLESVIEFLENSPFVIFAEPNFEISIAEVLQISISSPDQYAPPLLLQSSPPDYYGQETELNIGLDSAHMLAAGDNIRVAVIDNGIEFGHPLFESRIDSNGFDFIDDDDNPSEVAGPVLGHGTFVSGLVVLVAPNCKIIPIRSFDENGQGSSFSIAQGIYHAINNYAHIINMSFGTEENSQLVELAISTALDKGLTLVASSGNDGKGIVKFPAAYPGVIAVTAIDSLELIADFSNYGEFLDISSPGVDLYSSLAGQYEWGWWSGTSFSASIVSGVSALVVSRSNRLSPFEIELLFRYSTRTELAWGTILPPDSMYGYGVVDAFQTVIAVGRGDLNNSGYVDVLDLNRYINFIFRNGDLAVVPHIIADFNCDNSVNLLDLNGVVNYIFRNGRLYDPCY